MLHIENEVAIEIVLRALDGWNAFFEQVCSKLLQENGKLLEDHSMNELRNQIRMASESELETLLPYC